MKNRDQIPECHLDTYDKWRASGMKVRVDYLSGAKGSVWIECRNGVQWHKHSDYRIHHILED